MLHMRPQYAPKNKGQYAYKKKVQRKPSCVAKYLLRYEDIQKHPQEYFKIPKLQYIKNSKAGYFDVLDSFLMQKIFDMLDMRTKFKLFATCRILRDMKIKMTSLIADEDMTDYSLHGFENLKFLDCDRNERLTGECLKYVPNLEHLCLGYNGQITNHNINKLEHLKFLEMDASSQQRDGGSYYCVLEDICKSVTINRKIGLRFSSDYKTLVTWDHEPHTQEYIHWMKTKKYIPPPKQEKHELFNKHPIEMKNLSKKRIMYVDVSNPVYFQWYGFSRADHVTFFI